jgi:hypothetical protein
VQWAGDFLKSSLLGLFTGLKKAMLAIDIQPQDFEIQYGAQLTCESRLSS